MKGGGTRKPDEDPSSSIGVLGGRGGGGGPGFARFAPDEARGRPMLASATANLPASANGGGTRNCGCGVVGGDGSGEGESAFGGDGALPPTGRRDGGGAGGGPLLLAVVDPVFCGLSLGNGALDGGGGGGGAALDLLVSFIALAIPCAVSAACFCAT